MSEDYEAQIAGLRADIARERGLTAEARKSAEEWQAKHAARDGVASGFESQAQAWDAERASWAQREQEHAAQAQSWQRRDALLDMGITDASAVRVASAMYPGEEGGTFSEWLPQQASAPWMQGYAAPPVAPAPPSAQPGTPPAPVPAVPVPRPNAGAQPAPPVASAVTTSQIHAMNGEQIRAHVAKLSGRNH